MVQSNSSFPSETAPEEAVPEQADPEQADLSRSSSSHRSVRWISILGMVILLMGFGLGWRWWAASQAQEATQSAAGQPPGLPVKLETVGVSTVEDSTEFIGSLESQQSVTVRPEVTGRVSQIFVAAGDRVTAGTPLIQLKPDQQEANVASVLASVNSARAIRANAASQIDVLEAERIAQQAEVALQEENYRRIAALVEEGALPQQQLDGVVRDRRTAQANLNASERRIQAARSSLQEADAGLQQAQANANRANVQLQETTIVAPFDGVVGDIPVRLGEVVSSDDVLTTITQNDSLDLRLSIPLERGPELRIGQRVELTDAEGKVMSVGQISFINSSVDSVAQSILAKATFSNATAQLRAGQFVRLRVVWQEQPGILIPTVAITRLAGEPFVFVAEEPESTPDSEPAPNSASPSAQGAPPPPALIARQRAVTLGNLQGNRYQVLSGIEPGEQVVVSGILNLADGVPIMPDTAMSAK